jgi:hypothetical protein
MNAVDFPSISLEAALAYLAETPRVLHSALVDATPEELRLRPDDNSFCLIEHACHLRDLEREGYALRLRRMLEERDPALAGFEGDVVARQRDYMSQDAYNAGAEFAIVRSGLLARAEKLTGKEMARSGRFIGRTITVCDLLAMMVEHDREHREEISALMQMRAAI